FEQADGGSIFLDEIGDMSLRAQAKVLRAIQEGEIERVGGGGAIRVDVRVLAATNQELEALARDGRFRDDLYFRLNVVPMRVPPLRERRDDIPALVNYFLERCRVENNLPPRAIAPEAMTILVDLAWPGNVRELANVVERLVILSRGPAIGPADLERAGASGGAPAGRAGTPPAGAAPLLGSDEIAAAGGLIPARRAFEIACIREGLRAAAGNVSEAARLLRIDRTNLHKKIQAYGIDVERNGSRAPENG
ncbi:MAG: sigma-54-dependent Fis family transcriptional regulator, partial [Candidatus Latescibacterota bacterium]